MSPKRKKQQITVDDIGNSTSSFGEKAEKFLNIRIEETDSFDDIINHGRSSCEDKITYSNDDVNQELNDILLEGFDKDAVMLYKPQKHKHLPKRAQTFLYKLNTVVNNNYQQVEPAHVEDYTRTRRVRVDLMDNVLREAKFEDGIELILMPCLLRLTIGEESFAAHADKEGRRGTEIVWVLDEDKHKYSDTLCNLTQMQVCEISNKRWKRGDIQLIANMIAAAQTNHSVLQRVYPERILGIKFDADRLYFYSAYITEQYLNELLSMNKNSSSVPLIVKKFPKTKELSLSFFNDRKEIFMYLSAMRKYAMRLEPIYAE